MSDILKRQNDVDARARLDQSGQRLQEGNKSKQESAPEKKKGGKKSDGRQTSVFIWPNTSAAEWRKRLKNKRTLLMATSVPRLSAAFTSVHVGGRRCGSASGCAGFKSQV